MDSSNTPITKWHANKDWKDLTFILSLLFIDVNECANGQHKCHRTLAKCTNTMGNYRCECLKGYVGNGIYCEDKNECADSNYGGCDVARGYGNCVNLKGGYECTCSSGYVLDALGMACEGTYLYVLLTVEKTNLPSHTIHIYFTFCINIIVSPVVSLNF